MPRGELQIHPKQLIALQNDEIFAELLEGRDLEALRGQIRRFENDLDNGYHNVPQITIRHVLYYLTGDANKESFKEITDEMCAFLELEFKRGLVVGMSERPWEIKIPEFASTLIPEAMRFSDYHICCAIEHITRRPKISHVASQCCVDTVNSKTQRPVDWDNIFVSLSPKLGEIEKCDASDLETILSLEPIVFGKLLKFYRKGKLEKKEFDLCRQAKVVTTGRKLSRLGYMLSNRISYFDPYVAVNHVNSVALFVKSSALLAQYDRLSIAELRSKLKLDRYYGAIFDVLGDNENFYVTEKVWKSVTHDFDIPDCDQSLLVDSLEVCARSTASISSLFDFNDIKFANHSQIYKKDGVKLVVDALGTFFREYPIVDYLNEKNYKELTRYLTPLLLVREAEIDLQEAFNLAGNISPQILKDIDLLCLGLPGWFTELDKSVAKFLASPSSGARKSMLKGANTLNRGRTV